MNFDEIENAIRAFGAQYEKSNPDPTRIVIRTGAGGYDLLSESVERATGYERIYIGRKVPRVIRRLSSPVRKSMAGRYYKLVKI